MGHGKGAPAWQAGPLASWRAAPYSTSKGGGKGAGGGHYEFRAFYKGLVKGGLIPGAGHRADEQCLYIKNLPSDTTDQNLYELFAPFGAIAPLGVKAMLKEDGTCNSVGF